MLYLNNLSFASRALKPIWNTHSTSQCFIFAATVDQAAKQIPSSSEHSPSSLLIEPIFIFGWIYKLLLKTTSILPGTLHLVCIFLHFARRVNCHSETLQLFERSTNHALFIHRSRVSLWSRFCCIINTLILRTIIVNKSWFYRQVILLFRGL